MADLKEVQEKLDEFEEQINNDEKKKANIEGKKETILKKLKDEFTLTEKDDLKKILKDSSMELEEKSVIILQKITDFENKYINKEE